MAYEEERRTGARTKLPKLALRVQCGVSGGLIAGRWPMDSRLDIRFSVQPLIGYAASRASLKGTMSFP